MILKYIYTVFLGVLLATFVGVGIAAFYPEPKYPEFPPAFPRTKTLVEEDESTRSAVLRKQEIADGVLLGGILTLLYQQKAENHGFNRG